MQSVFLAFPYRDDTHAPLVGHVRRLIESHDLRVLDGKGLGGGGLSPAVMQRIEECDALVAVMTPRDVESLGRPRTTDWTRDEFGHARSKGRPCVALLVGGVALGGAHSDQEAIAHSSDGEHFVLLSMIIREWKQKVGRTLNIKVLPSKIAEAIHSGAVKCEYRFRNPKNHQPMGWEKLTNPWREPGGIFVQINGFRDGHLLEIQATEGQKHWTSEATAGSWIPIDLTPPATSQRPRFPGPGDLRTWLTRQNQT